MKTTRRFPRLLALGALALVVFAFVGKAYAGGGAVVTPPMVGHWEGSARIIVIWCKQEQLPVVLDIQADGTVTGTVGDAQLSGGRLLRNRGWLGRKLHLATDYIVRGDLNGPGVAAESITRSGVSMPLHFTDGTFTGSVHTSGSKFGGREAMILSASGLKLTRSKAASAPTDPTDPPPAAEEAP